MLALVLGGARSGKSGVAERLAPRLGERVVYLATGQAFDDEMQVRIDRHQQQRPAGWVTVEEPMHLADAIRQHGAPGVCLLVDALGTWITNLMLAEHTDEAIAQAVADVVKALQESGAAAAVVSDETGLGIVPATPMGRRFRDCLGLANQAVAAAADRVLLVVAGIPVDLKQLEVQL